VGKLLARNLDPRQLAVMANADLRETECMHCIFGALHLAQLLSRDPASVFDARGEACASGLVGQREPSLARQRANLLLAQLRLGQRRPGPMHRCGSLPGPQITVVVHVLPVSDVRESELLPRRFHLGEQLVLAIKAAIAIVARVLRVVQFACLKDAYRNAMLRRKVECCGQLQSPPTFALPAHSVQHTPDRPSLCHQNRPLAESQASQASRVALRIFLSVPSQPTLDRNDIFRVDALPDEVGVLGSDHDQSPVQ